MSRERLADNIFLSENEESLVIIDQTKLPAQEIFLELRAPEELFSAIKSLKVRGAPAIGIFAGYSLYVLARQIEADSFDEFIARLEKAAAYLNSARPTAVNLSYAIKRVIARAKEDPARSIPEIIRVIGDEAEAIQREDIEMCRKISEYGLGLVKDGDGILTHCNAGPLATSRYGTALGPILLGRERSMQFHVYADETRPLLQGARLTAYELRKAGVDVTLICDNMAPVVMKEGRVQACFVGCDRVAANGDAANKIGTSGVAILAHHYGIPFYVLGPTSTIDMACPSGEEIPIELRDSDEVASFGGVLTAPEGIKAYNPSFDVTDHGLVTAIITEKGICYPPFEQSLAALFGGNQ